MGHANGHYESIFFVQWLSYLHNSDWHLAVLFLFSDGHIYLFPILYLSQEALLTAEPVVLSSTLPGPILLAFHYGEMRQWPGIYGKTTAMRFGGAASDGAICSIFYGRWSATSSDAWWYHAPGQVYLNLPRYLCSEDVLGIKYFAHCSIQTGAFYLAMNSGSRRQAKYIYCEYNLFVWRWRWS